MSAADHLNKTQFWDPAKLGATRTSDYPGTVGDGVKAMESWQEKFGGTGEARHYPEGESPSSVVEHYRSRIRAGEDIGHVTVVDWDDDQLTPSIKQGHHRAVAHFLEGVPAPVKVRTPSQFFNGG